LVAADGGVFTFGDAHFYGSMGARPLSAPIVAMAATPDGKGYWLVAADGGVFTFGDAHFYGSMGSTPLSAPVAGMAATPDGKGYWLVAADGGVFTFGDAHFYGSAARDNIGTWVTGIAASSDGHGYWLVAATAGVLNYGDAVFYGPSPNEPPFPPTAAIAATPDGKGYWLLQPDSIRTTFAVPQTRGGFPGGEVAVQLAASQIRADPDGPQGAFCNPYGPCEEWCALFATWVWNGVGIAVPRFAWVPDLYSWAASRGLAMSPRADPSPGDLLVYGSSAAALPHVAVVAEVWPDGAVTTIDGDSGPEPRGQFAVTFNGPFLPADSSSYNGMAVFAFVRG
jgi:CHAP domain